MIYSEFKREVEAMGYSIVNGKNNLFVKDGRHSSLMSVGFRSTYIIDSNFETFRSLEDSEKERLLGLAWQLASTPLEEREDEQKYYVKFIEDAYLVRYPNSSNFGMAIAKEVSLGITQFTEKEIKDYDERFWVFSVPVEEVKEDE